MKKTITILIGTLIYSSYSFCQNTFSAQVYLDAKRLVRTWDDKCIILRQYGGTFFKADTISGSIDWFSGITYQWQSQFKKDIIQTSDSNYVAIINQIGPSNYISALKITTNGTLLWVKKYFAMSTNTAWDIIHTQDGGFIFVGGGCSASNYAIRCDANGDIIWQKSYIVPSLSNTTAFYISKASNDTYYISGQDTENIILYKIDGAGSILWFRRILMDRIDYNGGLVTTNDGGVTVSANTRVIDTNFVSTCLAHFDSLGNNLWLKVYTTGNIDNRSHNLIQMDDGSYIITGVAHYYDTRNNQMFNFKTDINGNFIWAKTAGGDQNGAGHDISEGIQKLSNSTILVCGNKGFSKLNTNGNGWCYPDTLNMLTLIPSFSIDSSITYFAFNAPFTSDTITYTYDLTPGFSPYICNNVTEIKSGSNFEEDISIYPNPFSDRLEFTVLQSEPTEISLYDIFGQKILEFNFIKSATLNTENLAKGLYIYEVKCTDLYCKKGKLVKD
jgi:hypothetical protein